MPEKEKIGSATVVRNLKFEIEEKGEEFLVDGKIVKGKTIKFDTNTMKELFRSLNPNFDIFHIYDYHPLKAANNIIPKNKLIFHAQYSSAENPLNSKIYDFEKNTLLEAKCKKIICVSKDLYKLLRGFGIKSIIYVPNGINTDKFKPFKSDYFQKIFEVKNGKQIVFHPHRLNPSKGLLCLIESVTDVIKVHNNFVVVIPNKDALFGEITGLREYHEMEIRKKISEKNLEKFFLFTEPVKYENMPLALNSADIVVFPSSHECYGLSIATLEAMSCGKPIIRTYVLGTRAAVNRNEAIVLKKDSKELSQAIIKLLANKGFGEKIGKNARKKVLKNYDQKKLFEKIHSFYN